MSSKCIFPNLLKKNKTATAVSAVGIAWMLRSYSDSKYGRRDAVEYTKRFQDNTLGHLVHMTVTPFAWVFGNFASGSIGAHYRSREEFLELPDTDENIDELARTETEWWNQQPGLPGFVGSLMSGQQRSNVLKARKTCLAKKQK